MYLCWRNIFMSLYDIVVSRRTVRQFQQKPVNEKILRKMVNAGRLAPSAANPRPGNEPVSYIVTLVNKNIKDNHYEWDVGAAVENMILVGWEYGIASCWLLSVERKEVRHLLKIPETYVIDSVLALGYPAEEPVEEIMRESIKYWKDKEGRLHVPKRKLKDILHFNGF